MASKKRSSKPKKKFPTVHMVEKARLAHALALKWRCSGRVMGIDLALRSTGIVILDRTGVCLRHLTIREPIGRQKKTDPPITETQRVMRLKSIAQQVVQMANDFKVHFVAIEGYAFSRAFQSHQIGEVAGVVKLQLFLSSGIIPHIVGPKTARKHVLGHGDASKDQIIEVVRSLSVDVDNDHEADAYVVARYMFDHQVAKEKEEGLA